MQTSSPWSFILKTFPLLLVIFIDGMGLGLVLPIINVLLNDPNAAFLSNSISPAVRQAIYGFTMGVYMLCWFFGAGILGDLSDQIGRKKSLFICLVGTFIGYVVSALAVIGQSLFLLILGRVIAGFTSGSQPIAQAMIIDLSGPEEKTRNLSYILLALSLGFVAGPILGGVLSNSAIVSWFSFTTPLYFIALVSLLNIILLGMVKETLEANQSVKIKLQRAITIFTSAFTNVKVRNLSLLFLIFILGWSNFFTFIVVYLLKTFAFTNTEISLYMALLGAGFGIGNGFLVSYFTKRFSLKNNFRYPLMVAGFLMWLIVLTANVSISWLAIMPIAMAVSISYAAILTLFSDRVSASEQGWVMGITGAIMALVWGVDTMLVGFIIHGKVALPIWLAGLCFIVAAILMTRVQDKTT